MLLRAGPEKASITRALQEAVRARVFRSVDLLLKAGADPNAPLRTTPSALTVSMSCLRNLIAGGASIQQNLPDGRTLLHDLARNVTDESADLQDAVRNLCR